MEKDTNTFAGFIEAYYPQLNYGIIDEGYYLYREQVEKGEEYSTRRLYTNKKGTLAGDGGWMPMPREEEALFRVLDNAWFEAGEASRGGNEEAWKEFKEKWIPKETVKEDRQYYVASTMYEHGDGTNSMRKMECLKYEENNKELLEKCTNDWNMSAAFAEATGNYRMSAYKYKVEGGNYLLELRDVGKGELQQWHIKDDFTAKEAVSFVKQFREFEKKQKEALMVEPDKKKEKAMHTAKR